MRTHGTLTKWNDDREFGFIEPAAGTGEIFVHISAFPRDGVRPRIGELVSFETELRSDGKHRAVRVMRPGSRAASPRPRRARPSPTQRNPLVAIAGVVAIGIMGWYSYTRLAQRSPPSPIQAATVVPSVPASPAPAFSCDGRTRCAQMTSCAEATFFIKQCPGTQMDGDGIPCESQWCAGGEAD
ncbi:cold shock domain-containing protein [Rhodanobacter sp. Col0626]|uniref:cold shock domain-containing protein n=1 Tax=Rhodanobacter sp. Col0626 TaxID=3415679 RepID=UPI003CF2ECF8